MSGAIAIVVRAYQMALIELIRGAFRAGHRRVLMQSVTGSGKTVMFTFILSAMLQAGKRIAILLHRRELVDQVDRYLTALGIPHGIIAAGYRTDIAAAVQVCSVPSVVHCLGALAGVDLMIVDEAHHGPSKTWLKIFAAHPKAWLLGVTATPQRLDGRGLNDIFDALICGPSVRELEELGFLTPAIVYGPPLVPDLSHIHRIGGDYVTSEIDRIMQSPTLVGDAVEHWRQYAADRATIAFCTSIAHSQAVCERFLDIGVRAVHVDGETPDDERRIAIAGLADGSTQVLSNCGLISEGVDVPELGALVILRPTASLTLHLQMLGRVGRPYEGKTHSVILDHAGNCFRLGLPNDEHKWSLEGRPKAPVQYGAPLKRCPNCGALIAAGCHACPHCGCVCVNTELPAEAPGRLVQVTEDERLMMALRSFSFPRALRWAGADEGRLRQVARARGYQRGWVFHRLEELRTGVRS
jgi:superfamily II DNA or RNA helicase